MPLGMASHWRTMRDCWLQSWSLRSQRADQMRTKFIRIRSFCASLALAALAGLVQSPAQAMAAPPIDGDIVTSQASGPTAPATITTAPVQDSAPVPSIELRPPEPVPQTANTSAATPQATLPAAANATTTYHKDDLIGAAESVFGKGAAGLAGIIEDLLRKQGEPNGYIVGREGGGALVVGLRYGSGTLHHKIEGERPVYWTGPSVGFDVGANAASAFVLVYNLYDTEDLYKRFGAGEGQAYLIGGFHISYLRRRNIVLIPVRAGAGLRLGINAGYMKFSHKQNWLPF
jgi:hypothetical protein